MTIAFPEAPSEARNAVLDALKKRAKEKSFLTPQLQGADPGKLDLRYAMRSVFLPLERIDLHLEPKPLHELVDAPLWWFLVHTGKKAIAAAYGVEGGPNWRIGEVAEGPTVEGTEHAVEAAAKDKELQRTRYEPVLLQAPALDVVAVWLRAPQPSADMVMPIPPSTAPFANIYQVMKAASFVQRLYEKAANIPRNDSARGG